LWARRHWLATLLGAWLPSTAAPTGELDFAAAQPAVCRASKCLMDDGVGMLRRHDKAVLMV
jgi:hypothetical protein